MGGALGGFAKCALSFENALSIGFDVAKYWSSLAQPAAATRRPSYTGTAQVCPFPQQLVTVVGGRRVA